MKGGHGGSVMTYSWIVSVSFLKKRFKKMLKILVIK